MSCIKMSPGYCCAINCFCYNDTFSGRAILSDGGFSYQTPSGGWALGTDKLVSSSRNKLIRIRGDAFQYTCDNIESGKDYAMGMDIEFYATALNQTILFGAATYEQTLRITVDEPSTVSIVFNPFFEDSPNNATEIVSCEVDLDIDTWNKVKILNGGVYINDVFIFRLGMPEALHAVNGTVSPDAPGYLYSAIRARTSIDDTDSANLDTDGAGGDMYFRNWRLYRARIDPCSPVQSCSFFSEEEDPDELTVTILTGSIAGTYILPKKNVPMGTSQPFGGNFYTTCYYGETGLFADPTKNLVIYQSVNGWVANLNIHYGTPGASVTSGALWHDGVHVCNSDLPRRALGTLGGNNVEVEWDHP